MILQILKTKGGTYKLHENSSYNDQFESEDDFENYRLLLGNDFSVCSCCGLYIEKENEETQLYKNFHKVFWEVFEKSTRDSLRNAS